MSRRPDLPRLAAVAGLGLGLAIAVTANIAYAIPRGPVALGVGLVAPLVLPVVLYLRTLFDAPSWRQWLPRELAMLAVAGPAVAVSYWHTFALVLGAGEPLVLALLAPLSSDGLAGMATLALHRLRSQPTKTSAARPSSSPRMRRPAPAGPDSSVPSIGKRAAGLAWARAYHREHGSLPTGQAIAHAVGASKPEGDRVRAKVKAELLREAS